MRKKDHQKLMVLLMENWPGTFNLKYHQEQRFIMSCGDQIAEFSPEQFVETAVASLSIILMNFHKTAGQFLITPLTHLLMNGRQKRKRRL